MATLSKLKLSDSIQLGADLRGASADATSMEDAASRTARYLFKGLTLDESGAHAGEAACALVRVYVTHPFGELSADLQQFAEQIFGARPGDGTPCLVLLGSAGLEPAWCSRKSSRGHQAIPLPDPHFVARIPMVAELLRQLGVDLAELRREELGEQREEKAFSVFLEPDAVGSAHIPAQKEFVVPYGVKSVLGFGASIPGGDMFVALLFSRVPVSRATANLFAPLSLNVKLAFLPFADGPLMSPESTRE
jgi:two-component system NtrC family sensor kinase